MFKFKSLFHLLFYFTSFIFSSCAQDVKNQNVRINLKAKQLNDSAVQFVINTNDYEKAITLLDESIKIDTGYITAYSNKLSFQVALKKYKEAIETGKALIRLQPNGIEFCFTEGLLYELTADTSKAFEYYKHSLTITNKVLDTITDSNVKRDYILLNKATILSFLNRQQEASVIYNELYTHAKDSIFKEIILDVMNKPKNQLIKEFFEGTASSISTKPQ